MNKKGVMSIAIGLLVLATLLLTSFALYTFITKTESLSETIGVPAELSDVYVVEEQVNFYLAHGGELGKVPGLFGGVKVDETDKNFFVVEKIDKDDSKFIYKFKVKTA